MFCATRWYICVPIGCGIADVRHDLLDLWSSRSLAIPTLLDQLPQGVRDPDLRSQASPGERQGGRGTRAPEV